MRSKPILKIAGIVILLALILSLQAVGISKASSPSQSIPTAVQTATSQQGGSTATQAPPPPPSSTQAPPPAPASTATLPGTLFFATATPVPATLTLTPGASSTTQAPLTDTLAAPSATSTDSGAANPVTTALPFVSPTPIPALTGQAGGGVTPTAVASDASSSFTLTSYLPWLFGVLGLILIALLIWLISRRKS